MIHSNRLTSLLFTGALAAAMVLGVAQPVHATLTKLTVTLSDPVQFPGYGLPSTLSDTVAVIIPPADPDREIFAGNGTHIGGATIPPVPGGSALLAANEYVNARPTTDAAAANRIVLGLEAGTPDNKTGYTPTDPLIPGSGAYYSFSNFVFSTPSIVTGFIPSSENINGLDGQISFAGGVLKVLIGNLTINGGLPNCGELVACGTITLDLTVQAVPEPGTFALIGVGLLVVVVVGRMRRRG